MINLNKQSLPVYITGTSNHKVNDLLLIIENDYDIRKNLTDYLNNSLNNKLLLKAMKKDIRFYINNYSDNFIIDKNKIINLNIVDYLNLLLIRLFLKLIYPSERNYILNMVSRHIYNNLSDYKIE